MCLGACCAFWHWELVPALRKTHTAAPPPACPPREWPKAAGVRWEPVSVATLAAGHWLVLEPHGVAQILPIQELVQQPPACGSPSPTIRLLIESPWGGLSEQTPAHLSVLAVLPRPVDDSWLGRWKGLLSCDSLSLLSHVPKALPKSVLSLLPKSPSGHTLCCFPTHLTSLE